jgi:hypothetical protein
MPPYMMTIIDRQDCRCWYCKHLMVKHRHLDGEPTPRNAITKDHLEPRVYGGLTILQNLVAACSLCNVLRGEIDAKTFSNLQRKWFKRDPSLWARWHNLNREEYASFKLECLRVHERQLRGIARHYVEYAFRHDEFTNRYNRRIKWA